MTPKELLYLEDSLGMEQQLQAKCNEYSTLLQDTNLKSMVSNLGKEHQAHFNNLMAQFN
ncbi:MAG: hypothetical protein LBM65_07385 [Oscillospiraceae bacterium]|nr:hypothetical protein [Oscillospiraceae bacterium]